MSDTTIQELLELNQRLLNAIATGDWDTYQILCDPTLSAFEPEARGHLVEGMEFHRFYFAQDPKPTLSNTTIAAPHVRLLGDDVAIVSYIRLLQSVDESRQPRTASFEETRVWQRQDGTWRHVHFHRSENG